MCRTLVGFRLLKKQRNAPSYGGVRRPRMCRTLVGFTDLKKGKMLPAMVGSETRNVPNPGGVQRPRQADRSIEQWKSTAKFMIKCSNCIPIYLSSIDKRMPCLEKGMAQEKWRPEWSRFQKKLWRRSEKCTEPRWGCVL
jgi:hypothetical protein